LPVHGIELELVVLRILIISKVICSTVNWIVLTASVVAGLAKVILILGIVFVIIILIIILVVLLRSAITIIMLVGLAVICLMLLI
jgi:hypothetical protein